MRQSSNPTQSRLKAGGNQDWLPHLLLLCAFAVAAHAQGQQHVTWELSPEPAAVRPGGEVFIGATGTIDPGWHLYSVSSPGGLPAKFQVGPETLVKLDRVLQPKPQRKFDPNLNSDTEFYEDRVTFLPQLSVSKNAPAGAAEASISVRYQTCSDTKCVQGTWTGTVKLNVDPAGAAAAPATPAGYAEAKAPTASSSSAAPPDQGLAAFLAVALGFGLASIFTPCVFPMIPITMSYFLNRQSGGKRDGVVQAVVFCLGIIVLFSGLGLATSALLGPVGVKQLGSNKWVNGFIAALFIAFGLSLLGAFEITIPSSILTRLNRSSEKGGFAGTLLMGLTFSLSSFACVGPFVGTLLAASAGGGGIRPLLGMVAFATGLALPFFLLAVFPSYLKRMPRSGGWLARVKVVMGFVILAASLKYVSSVDQVLQWGLLTRGRFLAAWIVLLAMAGLYLLGFVRLEGIKPDELMGLGRLLTGMAFLTFALSLLPGMQGGKLGLLDAYVPAADETSAGASQPDGLKWMKDQYREALARARAEGKLVFIDFTGYTCANCHWMRANMLSRPEVVAALKNFVLVELYTDGPDAASDENGKLELARFHTVAQPFYAIVDPDEKVIATFEGRTSDVAEYMGFLRKAAAAPAPAETAAAQTGGVAPFNGIAAYPGKVVVVNFWATWCVPCMKEIPGFNRLQHQFADRGVVVLGVLSLDDADAESVRAFIRKRAMEYTVLLGSDAVAKQYALDNLPVTVVFDRSGKQVKRFDQLTSDADIQAAVERLL